MKKKILVKSLNWIGDAIMATPFLKCLKNNYKEYEINVLCRPWVAEVYRYNPNVDKLIIIDDKKNKFKTIKLLRQEKFNFGILLPKSLGAALLFKLGGIKNIIGYNTQHRGFLLSKKIRYSDEIKKQHQVFLHLNILKEIGCIIQDKINLELYSNSDIDVQVKSKWCVAENKYLGINPGAAFGPAKRWFPERFAEVIDYCYEKKKLIPVIIGGPKEKYIAEEIIKNVKNKNVIINLVGKTSLLELISVIKCFDVMVTNDSGPMHMASALNINLVALFASTNPITTGPYNKNSIVEKSTLNCSPCIKKTCKYNTYDCIKEITAQKVIKDINKFKN